MCEAEIIEGSTQYICDVFDKTKHIKLVYLKNHKNVPFYINNPDALKHIAFDYYTKVISETANGKEVLYKHRELINLENSIINNVSVPNIEIQNGQTVVFSFSKSEYCTYKDVEYNPENYSSQEIDNTYTSNEEHLLFVKKDSIELILLGNEKNKLILTGKFDKIIFENDGYI